MSRILVTPRPLPDAPHRLVVFPHAGGGPAFYRSWASAVDDIEIRIVQYAGREGRFAEPPMSDPHAVVAEVCGALPETGDGRPTALMGHSMGAILAYETAIALTAERLSGLIVSGRRAPSTVTAAAVDPATGLVRPRTDEEILASLRRHGGSAMRLFDEPGMRELLLRVLRADYQLADSYQPLPDRPLLTVPVTALWGEEDPTADEPLMLPWGDCTTGPYHRHAFTGGHFLLVPHRDLVLERVRECLRGKAAPAGGRVPSRPRAPH
jgi:pyochelin biosynthetic protein PchC